MAQFKEATLANGDKIIINIELIRTMQRFADTTTIEIGDDYAVQIKEAPAFGCEADMRSGLADV